MTLDLKTIQHINFVVSDYDAAKADFVKNFEAELNWELEIPNRPDDVRAALLTLGPQLFELFGPEHDSQNGIGRIFRAQGPGYVGIEWGVGDLGAAKEALRSNGIRIKYEPKKRYYPGTWFVSEPADLFGLALECYIGTWYTTELPEGFAPIKAAPYWRDEHPLGIHGLRNFTVAVRDVDAAAQRWQAVTGAEELSALPGPLRDMRYFTAANTVMGLVGPSAGSEITDYLDRRGESIHGVTFTVTNVDTVAKHLANNSITVQQPADGIVVVPAAANHGVRLEFVNA